MQRHIVTVNQMYWAKFLPPLRFSPTDVNDTTEGHLRKTGPEECASRDNREGDDDDLKTGVITKTKPKTQKPSLYKVLLLNDDYTPMDFVVYVLERFFNKAPEEAMRIMLHVHQRGVGICGVYTYEIAETKVTQVMSFAQQNQHPLQCTMEKE